MSKIQSFSKIVWKKQNNKLYKKSIKTVKSSGDSK